MNWSLNMKLISTLIAIAFASTLSFSAAADNHKVAAPATAPAAAPAAEAPAAAEKAPAKKAKKAKKANKKAKKAKKMKGDAAAK